MIMTTAFVNNSLSMTAESLLNTLKEGSDVQALLALAGVAIVTLLPLTLIQNAYCFSVGYGASVATMALAMMLAFDVSLASLASWTVVQAEALLLVQAAFWYGLRLTAFLVWREVSVDKMRDQAKFFQIPATRVFPLAAILGMLYAMMVSPVLYALRGSGDSSSSSVDAESTAHTLLVMAKTLLAWLGVLLAYAGLLLEAVTDQHKSLVKQRHKISYGEKRFVGPTGGLYRLCRHPNFFFEIVFWTGLWLSGVPTFGTSLLAWVCGTLGWVSLVFIMKGSAARLDKKQQQWYGGQPEFEKWKEKVPASLVPSLTR